MTLDETFFEILNTEAKGYFYGFLASDGNISKTTNRISFCINTKDKYILEILKLQIGSLNAVRDYINEDQRNGNEYLTTIFQFSSFKIKNDLLKLGMGIDKSINFDIPKINDNIMWHFIRGLIDGDGHISHEKTRINLIATKTCLDSILVFCKKYDIIWSKPYQDKTIWKMQITTKNSTNKFIHHLYKDANIFLNRKKENSVKQLEYNSTLSHGIKRRPVKVFDRNNTLLYSFESSKECIDFIKFSTATFHSKVKNKTYYKDMRFEVEKLIKYNITIK